MFAFSITLQDLELSEEDVAWTGFLLEEFAISVVLHLCLCYAKTSQFFDRS